MTILDGLHTKFHLTLRTSTTPSNITLQVSLNTAIYIHQESTDMAQNNTIVAYALMPAAGAQQVSPEGQTYHLLPLTLVGEHSHRHLDHQLINDYKLTMGISHHPQNKPPVYVFWWGAVKDLMLARGYISNNWHIPDAEFQQIVSGMRRLEPGCDELATPFAANNMASMQGIDEAVFQLVKDCRKKLTKTIETNHHVPPPGPGIPPAHVIVNPILLPLNAPPQYQWSIATHLYQTLAQLSDMLRRQMLLGQPNT